MLLHRIAYDNAQAYSFSASRYLRSTRASSHSICRAPPFQPLRLTLASPSELLGPVDYPQVSTAGWPPATIAAALASKYVPPPRSPPLRAQCQDGYSRKLFKSLTECSSKPCVLRRRFPGLRQLA
jgi:hypothetical protein